MEEGHKIKDNKTNNNLQNTTHKTKDPVTRTPLKTGGELRCYGNFSYFISFIFCDLQGY